MTVCDRLDVQVNIHTDTLNESGFVEDTIAAFKGRTIHTYHTEGEIYRRSCHHCPFDLLIIVLNRGWVRI